MSCGRGAKSTAHALGGDHRGVGRALDRDLGKAQSAGCERVRERRMNHGGTEQGGPRKGSQQSWKFRIIAVTLFLAFWFTGLVSFLSGAGCLDERRPDAQRLRMCNSSIVLGAPLRAFGIDRLKGAALYLERGILRANKGGADEALTDMRAAMDRVGLLDKHYARSRMEESFGETLIERIGKEPSESRASLLWGREIAMRNCQRDHPNFRDECTLGAMDLPAADLHGGMAPRKVTEHVLTRGREATGR